MTTRTVGRRCIVDVMKSHAFLPMFILFDEGSQFRLELLAEIVEVLEIQLHYASTKPAQRIGTLERTHASLKTALEIATGQR